MRNGLSLNTLSGIVSIWDHAGIVNADPSRSASVRPVLLPLGIWCMLILKAELVGCVIGALVPTPSISNSAFSLRVLLGIMKPEPESQATPAGICQKHIPQFRLWYRQYMGSRQDCQRGSVQLTPSRSASVRLVLLSFGVWCSIIVKAESVGTASRPLSDAPCTRPGSAFLLYPLPGIMKPGSVRCHKDTGLARCRNGLSLNTLSGFFSIWDPAGIVNADQRRLRCAVSEDLVFDKAACI